jgi:hypothetical protein
MAFSGSEAGGGPIGFAKTTKLKGSAMRAGCPRRPARPIAFVIYDRMVDEVAFSRADAVELLGVVQT